MKEGKCYCGGDVKASLSEEGELIIFSEASSIIILKDEIKNSEGQSSEITPYCQYVVKETGKLGTPYTCFKEKDSDGHVYYKV